MGWDKEAVKYLTDFDLTFTTNFIFDVLDEQKKNFSPELIRTVEDLQNDEWLRFIYDFPYFIDDIQEIYAQHVSMNLPRTVHDISPYMPSSPSTDVKPDKPFNQMKLSEIANYIRKTGKFVKELYEEGWIDAILESRNFRYMPELKKDIEKYPKNADVYAENAAKKVERLARQLANYLL